MTRVADGRRNLTKRNLAPSPWRDAGCRLSGNRMAMLSGGIFLAVVVFCFAGPIFVRALARLGLAAHLDAVTQDPHLGATPPSWQHWLGTDTLGRDMVLRIMEGGQIAIAVAFTAVLVALVIGVTWGAVAAYLGGRVDNVMMRIVDVLYAFPTIAFVIVVASVTQNTSLAVLFVLIGAISWLTMARIVRGQVLSLRSREFVVAARCLGVPGMRILFRHIVPNTLGPVIVYATLSIPGVMLTEAFLSFLGVGVRAPRASWGTLVTEGQTQVLAYPWLLWGPGVFMAVTIFVVNFFGDALRDAFDPQMRHRP